MLVRCRAVDLAVKGLELPVHGPLLIRLAAESAVLPHVLQQFAVIEVIRALADIYFSIDSCRLRSHSILYRLLFTNLGHRDRLRVYCFIGEARLLLVNDIATLLACNRFPVVSVPTLLDLVGLLRHLPGDHVDFFIRINQ